MPDDVQRPIPRSDHGPVDRDALDELQVFVLYRPAWVGKDGFPLSWQHFQHGLRHIARTHLREQLVLAQGVRMANYEKDDWEAYQQDMTRMTEVPRNA